VARALRDIGFEEMNHYGLAPDANWVVNTAVREDVDAIRTQFAL